MKFKLTAQEKKWILYDVGNSAFVLLVSTILPIYFNALAQGAGLSQVEYLAYWGYAAAAATFLVALLGPLLGAVSDRRGRKKPLFSSGKQGLSRFGYSVSALFLRIDDAPLPAQRIHQLHHFQRIPMGHGIRLALPFPNAAHRFPEFILIAVDLLRHVITGQRLLSNSRYK